MEIGLPETLATRNVYTVLSTKFEVPKHYRVISPVGYGAYGFVVSAVDQRTGRNVAIKKNSRVFRDLSDCKRIVREILVLRHLQHDNIVRIRDMYLSTTDSESSSSFRDVYIVSDLMDTNLYSVIRSTTQAMDHTHYKYFVYQILRGLKYMHSAGVMHRDLKPANILVNVNCDLQICDFGLARQTSVESNMTDYVVTRYYRPPEVLLMCTTYTHVVDTWSVGCIFAELVTRQTLFKGSDYIQQLDIILNAMRPTPEDLSFLENEKSVKHVSDRVEALGAAWGPQPVIAPVITDPVTRAFLMRMLVFDPRKRATTEELLAHPYLEQLHDPNDEPVASVSFSWEFEGEEMNEPLLRRELHRAAALFEESSAASASGTTDRQAANAAPPPA
jgi:serine/threonine protein kinase